MHSHNLQNALKSFVAFLFLSFIAIAGLQAQQGNIVFSPLGAAVYKSKIADLEKYKVPKNYTDKSAQAWYEEILTDRNKSLLFSFKENMLLHDSLLLEKCNSILERIAAANKAYSFDSIRLYINRSTVANAACYGEGTVMVNLGLFLWVDNDDELALVIGHELAHQLLKHSESRMEKSIAMLTSEDFKAELKNIKRTDYGKFDRFRKLMKGLNIESGKHSTYKESEADSLGVLFTRNAGFNVTQGSQVILKLDKVDELFTSNKLYTFRNYFENSPVDLSYFKVKTKYKGLSSVAVTMNADKDLDSVKTHPDCKKRYEAIMKTTGIPAINCCTTLSGEYKAFKERALLEIVRYLYENDAIGLCTHMSLFALENKYDPAVYNRFLSLCFSKLYYKDKKLERFNAVNSYASPETTLKELQDFLFAVSAKDLETLSLYFLVNNNPDTNSEDHAFVSLMHDTQVKMKDTEAAYAAFNRKFPNNKYQYLLQKK